MRNVKEYLRRGNKLKLNIYEAQDPQIEDMILRVEVKLAALRSEMLKWFIGASLLQTSTLMATIFAAIDFLVD